MRFSRTRRRPLFVVSEPTLNGQLRHLVRELVDQGITLQQARDEFERQFLLAALDRHDGSLSRSAESVGIHRNTLRNKICTLGIGEAARR
jgi:DNA-binding NtrC family response regulator